MTVVRSPIPVREDAAAALHALLHSQAVNTRRSVAALRPFKPADFKPAGAAPAALPSPAHLRAANLLISTLQKPLAAQALSLGREPAVPLVLKRKAALERGVKLAERVWAFYNELFSQRGTRFGDLLLGLDRMALDCYQAVYGGLGRARSIPSPPPYSFMETERTPSTFRRGVHMSKLGKRANPFPIVQLPLHRMVNPWTLGAVHHEVAHNLQSDLGLWQEVPRRLGRRLSAAGLPQAVVNVWQRWHKETWADLCAVLLGGPAIVNSLFDVLVRPAHQAGRFNPKGVHPTPYLRALINLELLAHLGFTAEAAALRKVWRRLYPAGAAGSIPPVMLETFVPASRLVVQTICFEPYAQLGDKALAEVTRFNHTHRGMVQEAATRVAQGLDPGILPERFLVAAARQALTRGYAPPEAIRRNVYRALLKR